MTAPVSPEEERDAMAWLDQAFLWAERNEKDFPISGPHKTTLRRLLARPVLPEEPTPEILCRMRNCWSAAARSGLNAAAEAYRGLRAELTKPATREVWEVTWSPSHDTLGGTHQYDSLADACRAVLSDSRRTVTKIEPKKVSA